MEDKTIQNHGFIPDVIAGDHYVLGAALLPTQILQPSGQWDEFLPPDEAQARNGVETQNCTGYGTLSAIEILFFKLWGIRIDFSERYVGIMSGTRPPGNSPHTVCECIRTLSGLIEESLLPFHDQIENVKEYYSPVPMAYALASKGLEWLSQYEFGHEWVFRNVSLEEKQQAMIEALKYSPLGISVFAWIQREDGLYIKPRGASDNHWTVCYGYEEGKYWKIFDSYDFTKKQVAWDTDFTQAKRFHVKKIERKPKPELSLWKRIINFFLIKFK